MEARNLARVIQFTAEFKDSFEGRSPFTEAVLNQLHLLAVEDIYVCGGNLRTHATDDVVIEANFEPAKAADVILKLPLLLDRARDWPRTVAASLGTDSSTDERTLKIRIASDAFYDLLVIHPYRGGNGRVARAFLHLMLYDMDVLAPPFQAYSAMAYRRDQYFQVLRAADAGDRLPMYKYLSRAVWQAYVDRLCDELIQEESGKYLADRLPADSSRFLTRPQTRLAATDYQFTAGMSKLGRDLAAATRRLKQIST